MEARSILGLADSTTKRLLKDMVTDGVLVAKRERKQRGTIWRNKEKRGMESIVEKLKELIDRNGPGYPADDPYRVYK